MPLVHGRTLGEVWGLAMWPLAMGAARLGQIRRGRRRSRPCRDAGRRVSSPRAYLCPEFGRKDTRRRRTSVAGGDGRGDRDFGEGSTRFGQQAMLWAPRSPRGGARVIGWLWKAASMEGGAVMAPARHGTREGGGVRP
jgi:hypothetical protein